MSNPNHHPVEALRERLFCLIEDFYGDYLDCLAEGNEDEAEAALQKVEELEARIERMDFYSVYGK